MRYALLVALLAACIGCQHSAAPGTPLPVTTPQPVDPVVETPPADSPRLVRLWWRELPSLTHGPGMFQQSPNQALLMRSSVWSGSEMMRATDGARAFDAPIAAPYSIDRGWHTQVAIQNDDEGGEDVVVTTLLTHNPLQQYPLQAAPEAYFNLGSTAVISADAAIVSTLTCLRGADQGDSMAVVRSWQTQTGEPGPAVELDGACAAWGISREPQLIPTPSGGTVLITDQAVHHVQLASGDVHTLALGDTFGGYNGRPLGAMSVDPTGTMVALVTFGAAPDHGVLHVLSLPSLDRLATISARVSGINQRTYMPGEASPIAWSGDGRMAHVGPDGRMVLRDVDSFSVIDVLDTPVPTTEQNAFMDGANAPVAATFFNGGELAVSYEQGVALWGTAEVALPSAPHHLHVLLDGPETLEVGQTGNWIATHLGGDQLHSHQFFVDGEPFTEPLMRRDGDWTPTQQGTFEIVVVVEDGLDTGVAVAQVTVL